MATSTTRKRRKTGGPGDAPTAGPSAPGGRLPVLKTYKLYIGGKFPRTESGHYYTVRGPDGRALANMCLGSRKDARDAVAAARAAVAKWQGASAFLRGQILYRVAEMLEGRRGQFVAELEAQGRARVEAVAEVDAAIDRFVYFAGWTDKYQQVFSAVNPVSTPHFNFSVHEPMGVVALLAPEGDGLIGLVSHLAPVMAGGNTCVALASSARPLCAVTLAEVLHASDVPGGVVNVLTGRRADLLPTLASHMDVNAVIAADTSDAERTSIQTLAAGNIKRVALRDSGDWRSPDHQHPYLILDTQEIKTTWHPIGA